MKEKITKKHVYINCAMVTFEMLVNYIHILPTVQNCKYRNALIDYFFEDWLLHYLCFDRYYGFLKHSTTILSGGSNSLIAMVHSY
jgi:hypothetical protein